MLYYLYFYLSYQATINVIIKKIEQRGLFKFQFKFIYYRSILSVPLILPLLSIICIIINAKHNEKSFPYTDRYIQSIFDYSAPAVYKSKVLFSSRHSSKFLICGDQTHNKNLTKCVTMMLLPS